jgi:phosphoglycolate phosphatase
MCHIHHVFTARHDAILFDLDGTLTDSAPGIVACMRYALDEMGIPHPDDATLRTFLGPPLAETFGHHFHLSGADIDRAIAIYRVRYHDVGLFENSVYADVPEVLAHLDATDAVLAIATSKPTYSATRILERFGLAGHFAFIGGAELDGTRHAKADVIAHTLLHLQLAGTLPDRAAIVMVGDREHDVLGARAHDIDCIGVLWGYGDADELTAAGAVGLCAAPADLLAALTR